jgi:hypothetical protein
LDQGALTVSQLRLIAKFAEQQSFAAGYSPLYARLFELVARWLDDPADPLAAWLVGVGEGRRPLDVTLLLPAALHREMLLGEAAVAGLARYFPTVGGDLPPDDPKLERVLREAILGRQEVIGEFIRSAGVQTNETGRGVAWLLPLLLCQDLRSSEGTKVLAGAIHLIDLGASAGLNLLAEQRAYRLVDGATGATLLDVGQGEPVQFRMVCRGELDGLRQLAGRPMPMIASRTGCDLAPVRLETAADETKLMAFIWGDQVGRMARLREGLAAYHRTQQSIAPVRVYPADLPADTVAFLQTHVPSDPPYPVVLYNTTMTMYLADKGASLRQRIGQWAGEQDRPVLWLQWEPAYDGPEPPENGWCAWTADLWQGGEHRQWQLGWVHPHGTAAQFDKQFTLF